jgi:hypothetical protein
MLEEAPNALPVGCTRETWAGVQEIILDPGKTIVEIIHRLNTDTIWANPVDVIRLIESVAGARNNASFLIDLIKKVSETR